METAYDGRQVVGMDLHRRRLWPRSFADVVFSLAGLTPSYSLTPGADLQGR